MTRSRNLFLGAAMAGALLLPTVAFADVHSEIVNAAEHAGYARLQPISPAYTRICITP